MHRFFGSLVLLIASSSGIANADHLQFKTYLDLPGFEVDAALWEHPKIGSNSCNMMLRNASGEVSFTWFQGLRGDASVSFLRKGWKFSDTGYETRVHVSMDDRAVGEKQIGANEGDLVLTATHDRILFLPKFPIERALPGATELRVQFLDGLGADMVFSLRAAPLVVKAIDQCRAEMDKIPIEK